MLQKSQRHVEEAQIEYLDNHVHIPVHRYPRVPLVTTELRRVDVQQVQIIDKIVYGLQPVQRRVPMVQDVPKRIAYR